MADESEINISNKVQKRRIYRGYMCVVVRMYGLGSSGRVHNFQTVH